MAVIDDYSNNSNTKGRVIDNYAEGKIDYPNDHDWFKVNLIAGKNYFINTSNIDNEKSPIRILNNAGQPVFTSAPDPDQYYHINYNVYKPSQSGSYYIDISETYWNPYRIEVRDMSTIPQIKPHTIANQDPKPINITFNNDTDITWFSTYIEKDAVYQIKSDSLWLDSNFEIFDNNAKRMSLWPPGEDDGELGFFIDHEAIFVAPKSGQYYIRIDAYWPGTYDFTFVRQYYLNGTAQNDTLNGHAADDILNGLDGDDTLNGFAGRDTLKGGNGNDLLNGDRGNDQLNGEAGDDTLKGGDGDDNLNGGASQDTLIGGTGDDYYNVNNSKDRIIETSALTSGIDHVYSTTNFTLPNNVENLTISGQVIGIGNSLDNVLDISYDSATSGALYGQAGNDTLYGRYQDDLLDGGDGDDLLSGHEGNDTMIGGTGNDQYIVTDNNDTIIETSENPNEIDVVQSSVSFNLTPNVENLVLSEDNTRGQGNNLANKLFAYGGHQELIGGAGNDRLESRYLGTHNILEGSSGKDTYALYSNINTLRIHAGDSPVNGFDVAFNFDKLDNLDLDSDQIASNIAQADGLNSGLIRSHHINNGLITFDNIDNYAVPLTIKKEHVSFVLKYLQNNITQSGDTVVFKAEKDLYVFQNDTVADTVVRLVGVSSDFNSLSSQDLDKAIQLI